MKKLFLILLCVFLAFVVIGFSVFPDYNFDSTVNGITSYFSPVFSALSWLSEVGKNLLVDSYGADLELAQTADEKYYLMFKKFIPYYLDLQNNYDTAAGQGFNAYTTKYSFHDHKLCVWGFFDCYDAEMIGGDYFYMSCKCYYCAICDKIFFISANINAEGLQSSRERFREFYAPDNSVTLSMIEEPWAQPWLLYNIEFSFVKEYIHSLE